MLVRYEVDYTATLAGESHPQQINDRRSVGENGGRLESSLRPRDED